MRDNHKAAYSMIVTGLMAAIVFVTTRFIQLDLGFSRIKTGNIFCLLSGMLLGPVRGGLAAGIGSMLYDLTDPRYTAMAYVTLINFFAMGCLCGYISHLRGKRGLSVRQNLIAAVSGALLYIALYFLSNIITQVSGNGQTLVAASIAMLSKLGVSLINAAIGVTCSTLLSAPLMSALNRNGLLNKLSPPKE